MTVPQKALTPPEEQARAGLNCSWCSPQEAAHYLNSNPKTLEHWRATGTGPRYAKAGRRVLYKYIWLDEWLEARTVTSTAEARKLGLL